MPTSELPRLHPFSTTHLPHTLNQFSTVTHHHSLSLTPTKMSKESENAGSDVLSSGMIPIYGEGNQP